MPSAYDVQEPAYPVSTPSANDTTSMTSSPPQALCDLSASDLVTWCEDHDATSYRAVQIRRWLFGKRVNDYDSMHDVPASLRTTLEAELPLFSSKVIDHRIATDRTEKLLLELSDGEHVECVLMRETKRRTVCVSTQVGCGMGCVFCASGLLGLKRNLSTAEILEQVLYIDRLLGEDERITNMVVMGIGEPLANLSALLPAVDTLNEKGGMGLGARRITISTVGLPEKIRELAGHGKKYNLAVSLHAPNDELRNRIVPVNDRTGIDEILAAADEYFDRTGRRVTYEYVLLGGLNDAAEHARELAALLKQRHAHVNLIPMNPVSETDFVAPTDAAISRFFDFLEQAGVPTTLRKRKGADIDAACGQLRLVRETQQASADIVSIE
jgi:23S rRNA (adenine2503-C2)-methyltransferase